MKKWISLFDLCPIRPGMQKDRAARITAMSYLRDCSDKEQRMEKQLLDSSEYILLRGKEGSFTGLLQMVETNPVGRITGQALADLYNSVPKSYRKNAVFLMNTVTLNELSRSLGLDRDLISCRDDGTFMLMDKPIVLCNAMPFISQGSVPILFGDFSKVSIEDCGRDELHEEPYDSNSVFSVKISIPLENTGVSSVFVTSVWPFSLIFSLARRNEGNFFQAVPTTLSSSLAEVRLASLVAWA